MARPQAGIRAVLFSGFINFAEQFSQAPALVRRYSLQTREHDNSHVAMPYGSSKNALWNCKLMRHSGNAAGVMARNWLFDRHCRLPLNRGICIKIALYGGVKPQFAQYCVFP
jgi:hypothetical protein